MESLVLLCDQNSLVGPKWFWSDQIDLDDQNCFGHIEGQGIRALSDTALHCVKGIKVRLLYRIKA